MQGVYQAKLTDNPGVQLLTSVRSRSHWLTCPSLLDSPAGRDWLWQGMY
jgi:hypothetical protein